MCILITYVEPLKYILYIREKMAWIDFCLLVDGNENIRSTVHQIHQIALFTERKKKSIFTLSIADKQAF